MEVALTAGADGKSFSEASKSSAGGRGRSVNTRMPQQVGVRRNDAV